MVIQEEGGIEYVGKTGVELLTMAVKRGRGGGSGLPNFG